MIGIRRINNLRRRLSSDRLVKSINAILASTARPNTLNAENDFERLQAAYAPIPDYGYDNINVSRRASQRMAEVLRFVAPGDQQIALLDVATGDGVLGALFDATGFDVSLCDQRDWRRPTAHALTFSKADCCIELPYPSATFDIVTSFNGVEHFPDPAAAFAEIIRVTKSGGLIYLDFGPLYCSPWGLHAYRALRMPYPQFLFSPEFIDEKLREIGINDLGETRSELQYVNQWKISQYKKLWSNHKVENIDSYYVKIDSFANLVIKYPDCFTGRSMTYEDLIYSNIRVVFSKN